MNEKQVVIDAKNSILGRVASAIAKEAIKGLNVVVVNSDLALVSGRRRDIIEAYQVKRKRGGSAQKGPNFPSDPSRIIKRTVRGMLPYKQARGLEALKRVYCYDGVPAEYQNVKTKNFMHNTKSKTITLKELCSEI